MADITTVTFNCILLIVFPFPMNLGVSPCFHCTVLVLVYRVHTFCFHNTVVSSCYRLHTSCLHHAGVTSVCACVSDLFLKFAISRELMKECTHTVLTYGQSMMMFLYDKTWCQLHHEGSYM